MKSGEEVKGKENRFLTLAMGAALTSECRMRHGAIVVKHGTILGSACNVQKNDPRYVDWKYSSIHAEVRAMRKAGFPYRATVYVARTNNRGEPMLSKPCPNCWEMLKAFKCKIVWTE